MPLTKVQIISNAVSILGKGIVMSLVNQPGIIAQAEQAYDFLLPAILSVTQFRFATRPVVLPKLNETPVGGYWQYSYALPGDFLKLWKLTPDFFDWEIYENGRIYTNYNNEQQALVLEYARLVSPERLPAQFCKYLAYEIAAYLSLSSAQNTDYANYLDGKAAIEFAKAAAADAQNRPQTPLQSAPMISLRYVSQFANNG